MYGNTPIRDVVASMRPLTLAGRTRKMQQLIGGAAIERDTLHYRALLVTALREAKLWPTEPYQR